MINENIFKMNQPTIISNPGRSFSAHDLMRFCDALKEWKITPTLFFFMSQKEENQKGFSGALMVLSVDSTLQKEIDQLSTSSWVITVHDHAVKGSIVYKVQGLNEIFPQLVLQLPISLRSLTVCHA